MSRRSNPGRNKLPSRRQLVNAINNLINVCRETVGRVNSLNNTVMEITVVFKALRKKGILTDEEVKEAWEEFKKELQPAPLPEPETEE